MQILEDAIVILEEVEVNINNFKSNLNNMKYNKFNIFNLICNSSELSLMCNKPCSFLDKFYEFFIMLISNNNLTKDNIDETYYSQILMKLVCACHSAWMHACIYVSMLG